MVGASVVAAPVVPVALVVLAQVVAQVAAALGATANSPAGRSHSPLSLVPAMIGLARTTSRALVRFLARDRSTCRRSSTRMILRSIPAAPLTACSRQVAVALAAVAPVAVALAAVAPVAAALVVVAASLGVAQAEAAPVVGALAVVAPVVVGLGNSLARSLPQTRVRNICPNLAVSLSSPSASLGCTSPDVATPAGARVKALADSS